ncbi:MAG: glycosyltransferase, partial [Candidatus Paceibacterota bacterium]
QVTQFVAISKFISARIRCFYKRKSVVIYPPIKDFWLEQLLENQARQNLPFLYAGALVPYKNVGQIVSAFNLNGYPLVIAGGGLEEAKLKSLAGSNISFLGKVSDQELANLYKNSRALIFAAKEDFGLIPVESLACGLPVIGPYTGALKESLNNLKSWEEDQGSLEKPTGVFYRYDYKKLTSEIMSGIEYFIKKEPRFLAENARFQAQKFDINHFRVSWFALIKELIATGQLNLKG